MLQLTDEENKLEVRGRKKVERLDWLQRVDAANASHGTSGGTAKQEAIRIAIKDTPRFPGEEQKHWAKRLAVVSGASVPYITNILNIYRAMQIGKAVREKQRAEDALKCEVMVVDPDSIGPRNWKGWGDAFTNIKMVVEAYRQFARSRNDVYAGAFLADISEQCTKAQDRAAQQGDDFS